jgi:hypothetical protein
MEKYAVAVGEMFDAISFYGPFDTFEDAEYWAGNNASLNWWIVGLENPNA